GAAGASRAGISGGDESRGLAAVRAVPNSPAPCHCPAPKLGAVMSGPSNLSQEDYEELLKPLTKELSTLARWVSETKQRVVVLFEGRDTAGKGGSIDMFARVLNPRQCRIVALPGPSERERTQWYFQRYVTHLPAEGEIVLFDRSW